MRNADAKRPSKEVEKMFSNYFLNKNKHGLQLGKRPQKNAAQKKLPFPS